MKGKAKQGNKDKEAFRRTKRWIDFRKKLVEERGTYCQCCGKKTKLLQCHHMDGNIENYDKLVPEKFALLCSQCHKCVSSLEQIKPSNWYKIRSKEWVDLYSRFIIIGDENDRKAERVSTKISSIRKG